MTLIYNYIYVRFFDSYQSPLQHLHATKNLIKNNNLYEERIQLNMSAKRIKRSVAAYHGHKLNSVGRKLFLIKKKLAEP
jgi:hypothetical protein